jgi:hypothetical protein
MKPSKPIERMAVAVAAAALSAGTHATTLAQIDTFDSTLDGWSAGGGPVGQVPPVPPQRIASGGPAGGSDSFMRVTSIGGAAAGSRMVVNHVLGQWAGDYAAAGVTAIAMDLRNSGSTDLTLRLLFEDPIPNPPVNEALSLTGVTLLAGSGWQPVLFLINPADLLAQRGSIDAALGGTTVLRLFHSTNAGFPGEATVAVLDVDNIQAVPELQTVSMMLAVLGLFAALRARRRVR